MQLNFYYIADLTDENNNLKERETYEHVTKVDYEAIPLIGDIVLIQFGSDTEPIPYYIDKRIWDYYVKSSITLVNPTQVNYYVYPV